MSFVGMSSEGVMTFFRCIGLTGWNYVPYATPVLQLIFLRHVLTFDNWMVY